MPHLDANTCQYLPYYCQRKKIPPLGYITSNEQRWAVACEEVTKSTPDSGKLLQTQHVQMDVWGPDPNLMWLWCSSPTQSMPRLLESPSWQMPLDTRKDLNALTNNAIEVVTYYYCKTIWSEASTRQTFGPNTPRKVVQMGALYLS